MGESRIRTCEGIAAVIYSHILLTAQALPRYLIEFRNSIGIDEVLDRLTPLDLKLRILVSAQVDAA